MAVISSSNIRVNRLLGENIIPLFDMPRRASCILVKFLAVGLRSNSRTMHYCNVLV